MTRYCQKGKKMQAIQYSQARNNLREIINKVCDNFEEYIISTKDNKQAVLISQEEYNSMKETMYLLSSKANRDRLNEAIDEIENLKFIKKDISL
jgi:antitoxin YefM